jgi:hypothetical protein
MNRVYANRLVLATVIAAVVLSALVAILQSS